MPRTSENSGEYPDRVPVILRAESNDIKLGRKKFLVPHDFMVSQFLAVIRNRCKCHPARRCSFLPDGKLFVYHSDDEGGISD